MKSLTKKLRRNLNLEHLEGRAVPAVLVSQVDLDLDGAADDVRIIGDAGRNTVNIQDNGNNTLTISVDANSDGDFTDPGELNNLTFSFTGNSVALDIRLGKGNDTVGYAFTGDLTAATRDVNVNLGIGNDTFALEANSKDVLNGSRFNLEVTGGTGNDNVSATFDRVHASSVSVAMDLGVGNDQGKVTFDRIDNKAAVDVSADLGTGKNTFTLDLQGVGFNDQATMNVGIVGGAQKDDVFVNLHDDVGGGTLGSSLNIQADLLAGNDTFSVGMDYDKNIFRIDDHSQVSIGARGGAGNDILAVQGVGATGTIRMDADSLLDIALQGGLGNDTTVVSFGASDALRLEGRVRVRLDGGAGNDSMTCLLSNTANSTGVYDVVLQGGAGNDDVLFGVNPSAAAVTYGPLSKVVLNGGQGADKVTNTSKSVSLSNFFETVL